MITITRGAANTVILTLSENATLPNPVFLFVFTNDQTRQAYSCIAADTSAYTYRYNQFLITEKTGPDTLHGEISLPAPGDYHYAVYQQTSFTNLDPSLADGELETGKMTVIDTASTPPPSYDLETKTNIVYGE